METIKEKLTYAGLYLMVMILTLAFFNQFGRGDNDLVIVEKEPVIVVQK